MPTLPKFDDVTTELRTIDGPGGAPPLRVRIYTPTGVRPAMGALLWLHSGGYVLDNFDAEDFDCRLRAHELGCVVVAVAYRLAPEHPFPAQRDDAWTAWQWLLDNAAALNVDPAHVGVGGFSSGAHLAAGLSVHAREQGQPAPAFQFLLQPMLDKDTRTAEEAGSDHLFWPRSNAIYVWQALLGDRTDVPAILTPGTVEDASVFPTTYLDTGDIDPFVDEVLAFGRRLLKAGVATELHVHAGAFHAFDVVAPMAAVTRKAATIRMNALRGLLAG